MKKKVQKKKFNEHAVLLETSKAYLTKDFEDWLKKKSKTLKVKHFLRSLTAPFLFFGIVLTFGLPLFMLFLFHGDPTPE